MINTILAPTDGSEHARKAVAFACDLAATYHARLILLHVLVHDHLAEALVALDRGPAGPAAERGLLKALSGLTLDELKTRRTAEGAVPRSVLQHIARVVIAEAEAIARARGVKAVTSHVEDGDPVQRVLECADRENADLIVMGSRGLSDVEGLLVGSTSHKISHLSRCTVVTVK